MTLIIKELIIRGNVIKDSSYDKPSGIDEETLRRHLEPLKKEIERSCIDKVLQKLERERKR